MSQQSYEAPYIFGMHDPGAEHLMRNAGKPGWVVVNHYVGHDPQDLSGVDFTPLTDQGISVLCRINNGHESDGSIPHSSLYEQFAQRVANFIHASQGCTHWVLGNEMNYAVERPGIVVDWSRHSSVNGPTPQQSDPFRHGIAVRYNFLPDNSTEIRTTRAAIVEPGEVIIPELYADCFRLCRDAIRRLPNSDQHKLIVGAVAPWNTQTIYGSNANGDWVEYFADILKLLGPDECDGFALHVSTHGANPELITSEDLLPAPFQTHHLQFRVYRDFLAAVPKSMRHLTAYITEADQGAPWDMSVPGWISSAYAEIDAWNRQPDVQRIHALALYRWQRQDRWFLDSLPTLVEEFTETLTRDYRWNWDEKPAPAPAASSDARTGNGMAARNVRRSRGPKPDYCVSWIDSQFPSHLVIGQVVTAHVILQNDGSHVWSPSDQRLLQVGYRYLRNRRTLALGDEKDIRTDITQNVEPDESVNIAIKVALPEEPGNYTLELDLFTGGVGWLRDHGSTPLTRWLTVEPEAKEKQDETSISLPVPLFTDISSRLPRSGTPYARRDLEDIDSIIVSHTAANPRVRLSHIAQTHIRYGYPGIVYDFVVDATGQVFKVSDMHDVAQPNAVWSEKGVNVCLVGDFSKLPPPVHQLDATSRLCAWLAQNLNISPDQVIGLGEVTGGRSPGESFYKGITWKTILIAQIRLHLAALTGHGDTGRVKELSDVLEASAAEREADAERLSELERERTALESRVGTLENEIRALEVQARDIAAESVGGVRLRDWTDHFPRAAERYRPRRSSDVRYLVVHHSGIDAEAPLEEIAAAHRQEWPGILFDFYINAYGEIFQTQPLEEVIDSDEEYIADAIHIGFAGSFDAVIPTAAQIESGGKLVHWLLEAYPNLHTESVKGMSEFVDTDSPGAMWLSGRAWKTVLLSAVSQQQGSEYTSEDFEQLQRRIQDLQNETATRRRQNQELIDNRHLLEAENRRLQQQLVERQQNVRAYVVPQPSINNRIEELPRHPTLRYPQRTLEQITHLAIHHTATPPSVGPRRIAELHVAADATRGKEAWPGIGYHYYIHQDGTIDQTNELEIACYHVYKHNEYSVGIVFAGSFMNGRVPSSAQLRSGAQLTSWLMQELKIEMARVWGHREFPDNSTVCPGSEWLQGNRWRDLLFERIEQVKAGVGVKNIRHYLLLQPSPYAGAYADSMLSDSLAYIERFQPTVGYSVEDARNAEYVTIVGNEMGVSSSDEQALRQSGCNVERITGRTETEVRRVLRELAKSGQRFRTLKIDF